jgi:hypothetical protein
MADVLGGRILNLPDETYQFAFTGTRVSHQNISFETVAEVNYMLNVTPIRDITGGLITPGAPGWVLLPMYNYNWGSVRDVISALGLELISFNDNPQAGTTTILVRDPDAQVVVPTPTVTPTPTPTITPAPVVTPPAIGSRGWSPAVTPPLVTPPLPPQIALPPLPPGAIGPVHESATIRFIASTASVPVELFQSMALERVNFRFGDPNAGALIDEGARAIQSSDPQDWFTFVDRYFDEVEVLHVDRVIDIRTAVRNRATFGEVGPGTGTFAINVQQRDGRPDRRYVWTVVIERTSPGVYGMRWRVVEVGR